jgi:hypothetical protein
MRWKWKALAVAAVVVAAPARADTICEWYGFASAIQNAGNQPAPGSPPSATRSPERARALTQVALAMFEAVNAIDRRYETYLGLPAGDRVASQDAAAATAAYKVLLFHFPGQKAALDDNYGVAMEAIADAKAREAGRLIGEAAATAATARAGVDPAAAQTPYRPRTAPGVWTATQLPVFEPWTTALKPWFLRSYDEVRPAAPPALMSERWARDYDEVKRLGARDSKARTAHQTLMARYRITPDTMPTMRLVADAKGRSLVENARLFALHDMVADDAGTATAAAKLHYNFWRPVTAIRNGADDGSPRTEPDAGWTPLINTPNHPEYPCGHCTYAAASASVLKAEVGSAPPGGVRVSSFSIPTSVVQVLPTFDDWVREVSFSRTLGGVHYRFSNEAGEEVGRRVAAIAMSGFMRPLPAAKRTAAGTPAR